MQLNWKVVAGMILGFTIAGGTLILHRVNDPANSAWGVKSLLLLCFGILIIVVAFLYREDNFLGRLFNTNTGRMLLYSALIGGAIILIYIWVISIATWRIWPATTNYDDLLATGFEHGHLHIETQPNPALLALDDPYNPDNHEGIPLFWDLSLYKGEYYLYWGPVPALLLTIVKPFYAAEIPDNGLTFVFMVGLLVVPTLLILELWKNYFRQIPVWAAGLSVAFIGMINPILYILLEPRINEAAVASAQFFFIGGLYWLFTTFNRPSTARLALAGAFFACAVGFCTTLVVPIAFLLVVTTVWAVRAQHTQALKLVLTLGLPLFLGAIAYGMYNLERFDSITEFGLGYQLTQTDIHEDLSQSFSIDYAPPNLFKLLFNAFEIKAGFPFIKAPTWSRPAWFDGYNPKIYDYFSEDVSGILVASPFLIFALLAGAGTQVDLRWIFLSLSIASIFLFLTLLLFFYRTMRYLLDVLPALSLLACIGFWQGLELLRARRLARKLYAASGIGLCAYSITIGLIICYSNNLHRIRIYNPELIQQINSTFSHFYK